jgi:hypothetical protein
VRFLKNLQESTLTFKGEGENKKTVNFCGKLSFILFSPFFFVILSTSIIATYIFIIFTYTTIIISFEPYGLNVELQQFIFKSNKFPYFVDITKIRAWGEKTPKKG